MSAQSVSSSSSSSSSSFVPFSLSQSVSQALTTFASKDDFDMKLNDYGKQQSAAYRRLLDIPESQTISFTDEVHRASYLNTYVVGHAALVSDAIRHCNSLQQFITQADFISMLSIGGGPGSDLLGLLQHMISADKKNGKVAANILDLVPAWAVAWNEFYQSLETPIHLTVHNVTFNATDRKAVDDFIPFYKKANIVTMVKFASAVYATKKAQYFYETLLESMSDSAFLIIIDNWCPKDKTDEFTSSIRKIASKMGFSLLFEDQKLPIRVSADDMVSAFQSLNVSDGASASHRRFNPRYYLLFIYQKQSTT